MGAIRQILAIRTGTAAEGIPDATIRAHATRLYQALAAFRFVFFAMGVGLSFAPDVIMSRDNTFSTLVGVTGLFNILRVWWRPGFTNWNGARELPFLLVDLGLAITIVLLSGGLDSPFLIYSLSPVLTTAVFANPLVAGLSAFGAVASVTAAHEVSRLGYGDYPNLLLSNYLAISLLYFAVCTLTAILPFLANLNGQRRLRMVAADDERQRFRRQIHDDVAQTLAFLSIKAHRAQQTADQSVSVLATSEIREIAEGVRHAYVTVRDLLEYPDPIERGNLHDDLVQAARSWRIATGMPLETRLPPAGAALHSLSPTTQHHLVQIAKEALANAGKHAGSSGVVLSMETTDEQLTLVVRDEGKGFIPERAPGLGIGAMVERAKMIGATLEIRSELGKGTEVIVQLKLRGAGNAA